MNTYNLDTQNTATTVTGGTIASDFTVPTPGL